MEIIDAEEIVVPPGRQGDGGIYLVVADDTPEFPLVLQYAATRAVSNRAHVGILHVIHLDEFVHWQGVEDMMKKELRENSEKFIWNAAKTVNEITGAAAFYVREGDPAEEIVKQINEDPHIRALVLGSGTGGSSPGPLVSYFSGKGLSRLRVPLIIVPGHLKPEDFEIFS